MPNPISRDLRSRIVEAYEAGEGTYDELAERFGVGYATVSRMLRRARERGDLSPEPASGGPLPSIVDEELGDLCAVVEEAPDRTLVDLCDAWESRTGVLVSKSTMGRAVKRAGLTRKQKRFRPSERLRPDVEKKRRAYAIEVAKKDPERLVFLDESGCNIAMAPSHGWAPRGQRVLDHKPLNWGGNITVVAAITLDGVVAHDNFQGAMNTSRFLRFLVDKLCPVLLPGDVVVLDNLRPHHAPGVRDVIRDKGADLCYLPPYSPDLNPIELMWSAVKQRLRRAKERAVEGLRRLIHRSLESVDHASFGGWFMHCGYNQRT